MRKNYATNIFNKMVIALLVLNNAMRAGEYADLYTIRDKKLENVTLVYNNITVLKNEKDLGSKVLWLCLEFDDALKNKENDPLCLVSLLTRNASIPERSNLGNPRDLFDENSSKILTSPPVFFSSTKFKQFLADSSDDTLSLPLQRIDMLSPETKKRYDWGIEVLQKDFGVKILLPQLQTLLPPLQPWYKRYMYHMVATLIGLGVGSYLYLKYGQKGAVQ